MKITEYHRICPICMKIVYHKNKKSLLYSIDNAKMCSSCARRLPTNPMKNPLVSSKIRGNLNPAKRFDVRNKISKNNAMNSIENRNKIKITKYNRYGNANYNNSDKNKQTCILKYGKDNVNKVKEIKEKAIDTYTRNLAAGKYHIPNNWKTGYYIRKDGNKEWYDSSYELERMKYYDENNIKWTKKHKIRMPYLNASGLSTYYVPDFFINDDTIEEIKGWIKASDVLKANVAKTFCTEHGYKYNFLLGKNFTKQVLLSL